MSRSNLVARAFECFPHDSLAYERLAPIIRELGEIRFAVSIGEKNSNQFESNFDKQLEMKLHSLGVSPGRLSLIDSIEKQYDFVFRVNPVLS